MADTTTQLQVRDATGSIKILSGVSSSNGIVTYHALTGTVADSMNTKLENLITINNKVTDISSSLNYAGTPAASLLSTISSNVNTIKTNFSSYTLEPNTIVFGNYPYNDLNDGGLNLSSLDSDRKALLLYNHTNADVYIRVGNPVTASSGMYSFILAPSASKEINDPKLAKFAHYYSSSTACTQGYLLVTSYEYTPS